MVAREIYSNQGTPTEEEGSVQLTSSLRWLVLYKMINNIFDQKNS
jgi:hypothetical protein